MKNIPTHISTEKALTLTADFRRRTVLRNLRENGDEAMTVEERIAGIAADASQATRATEDVQERLLLEDIPALIRFSQDTFEGTP